MTYLLSIIIPAYNAGRTIAKTLESISDFLTSEVQLILVDDGSTDETSDVIESFVASHSQIKSIRQ